jgi:hypothetical protein
VRRVGEPTIRNRRPVWGILAGAGAIGLVHNLRIDTRWGGGDALTPLVRAFGQGLTSVLRLWTGAWPRLATCRTIRSRPRGVSRAFLCTFIRFSPWNLKHQQPQLPRSEPDGQPTESSHLTRLDLWVSSWVGMQKRPKARAPSGDELLKIHNGDIAHQAGSRERLSACPAATSRNRANHWRRIANPAPALRD